MFRSRTFDGAKLTNFFIIQIFSRHFPPMMKEHLSHDVVLLCVTCHQRASQYSALLKQQIAAEHGLYGDTSSQKFKEDPDLKRIKSHARLVMYYNVATVK